MTWSPLKTFTSYPDFADSLAEAKRRLCDAFDTDPFPNIPCSLLNSADIEDYVRMTGMLYPFHSRLLKSASCEVEIGDKCIYWDDKGKLHDLNLKDQGSFDLQPNSILFVNTKQYFQLPQYIAIRFNLRINHVHKGLLLGTGPLVDPGFEGHLLIPLHNLTTNKYTLRSGDPIAWVDFTKISPHKWAEEYKTIQQSDHLKGVYINFPKEKKNLKPWDYLTNAHQVASPEKGVSELIKDFLVQRNRGEIRSSIPEALESAKKEMRRLKNLTYLSIVGFAIGILAIGVTLIVSGVDLITQLNTRIQTTNEFASNALAEVRELKGRVNSEIRIKVKNDVVAELATTLDALKKEQTKLESDSRGEISTTRERISQVINEIDALGKRILEIESKMEPPEN